MKLIVIAQRGWVFQGNVSKDGDTLVIDNAKCIRKWGTTNGLGQLAAEGPTKNTVLDPMTKVRLHELAVVATIECSEKWAAL